jgi:hypothetical protein
LQELIVERLQPGLLRLLLSRTSRKLRLRAGKSRLLGLRAEATKLLAGHHLALKILRLHALLAHRRLDGVLVGLLVQGRDRLRRCKPLLALKLCSLNARTVAAERASLNCLRLLLGELLALLLLEPGPRGVNDRLRVRVLVLLDLLRGEGPNSLRAAHGEAGGGVEVRLGHPSRLIDVLYARLLRLR